MENFGNKQFARWQWLKVFALTCWLLWKNRCRGVMEGKRSHAEELIHAGLHLLMESAEQGELKHQLFGTCTDWEAKWTPPPEGFVRLDTDGSVNTLKFAACGGIVRNSVGQWLVGFKKKLGFLPSTAAELLALQTGLEICKQQGYSKVMAYTDSMEVYHMLMVDEGFQHPLRSHIMQIQNLMYSDWDLKINYTPRDNIQCADQLAKEAHRLTEGMIMLWHPPADCLSRFRDDLE
ncbi:uncharacterized protein LOC114714122 [Neltuma alba]|uniref:uncharacterized protein LOC114714122 n=1 Tax=Neltuma alba TaxID=207710 RepID=UPI0010A48A2D|nr:uncharacterized protein LOC114714122 [Prosopis alba]